MRSEDPARDEGPELDLGVTPLSYPGSWLSVSRVVGVNQVADDLHIISHRRGPQVLLRLTPLLDDRPVAADVRVTPGGLTWTHGGTFVELTFDGPSKLRFRGAGLGVRVSAVDAGLTPFSGTYAFSDPAGGWVFSNYGTGLRYLITPLCGHGRLVGDQTLGRADRAVVLGDDGETPWEVELREARSGSATKPLAAASMDALQLKNRARFDAFCSAFGPMRDHPAGDLAAYVLWSSLVGSEGFVRRPAMLMSKNWMDKVWAWDPCFNALALARAHPDLAWDQFLVVFDHQDPATGAIPDSVTHSEVLFNFVKPPIHGWALRQVRAQLPEPVPEQRLSDAYTRLALWTRYWLDHRRAPGRMLPYYEHGNDSGWDNSTTFDRDRVVESPDLASFLIIQLDVLAELAAELGLSSDLQRDWEESREALTRALVDELWDGAHFVAKAVDSRRPSTATSLLNLLPLVIADRLPMNITEALTEQVSAHLTPWGLATELPTSELYEPDGYWRGPIWGPSTVLIECGLRLAGREDVAHAVRERFLALCERSAFAENFDAVRGTGLRDRAYTWTASSYIMYADDRARPIGGPTRPVGKPR